MFFTDAAGMKRLEVLVAFFAVFAISTAGLSVAQSSAPSKTVTIHMKNILFDPDSTSVPAGTTVVFVNDDDVAHTVTATDKSFDSKDVGPGKRWQMTFSKPGKYDYVCIYHPGMKGEITVTSS